MKEEFVIKEKKVSICWCVPVERATSPEHAAGVQ